MRFCKTLILGILLCFLNFRAASQSAGFDILTVGPNTEALAINEATTAYLLGASNIYTNPANLGLEVSSSLNIDYSLWIGDLTNTHVATSFKKGNSTIALGLLASQANDFELRNRPGPSQGSFSVSYLSLAAGYAYRFRNLSAGLSFQYLREELYIYNASGYALNAGISGYWFSRKLILSAALLNLGKMDDLNNEPTPLPFQFRAGLNAEVWEYSSGNENSFPISISLLSDVVVPLDEKTINGSNNGENPYLNIGLSVEAAEIITLRGGYKTGDTERPISFGTGIEINNVLVNYALVPFRTGFGTVHSIGISYKF